MDRTDRAFIFGTAHHCPSRNYRSRKGGACQYECSAVGTFNRRRSSKNRRAAARRDIRNYSAD